MVGRNLKKPFSSLTNPSFVVHALIIRFAFPAVFRFNMNIKTTQLYSLEINKGILKKYKNA